MTMEGVRNTAGKARRPFTFFGGKGGTGKTTCAAAYAVGLARQGCKTLLISTDPAHSLSDALGVPLSNKVSNVIPNLWGIEIDAAEEAKRYIGEIQDKMLSIVSPVIVDEIKRQMEIAYMSPGAEEAAIFDKFVELMEELGKPYEAIVFDTAPTGHTLRLLSLPEILGAWIENLIEKRKKSLALFKMAGRFEKDLMKRALEDPVIESLTRRQEKFEKSRRYLTDAGSCSFFFVLNAERMPILETARAIELLEKFGVAVGGVVVNRVIPPEAGAFFALRLASQEGYLRDIEGRFGHMKIAKLPLLQSDIQGMDQVVTIADLIGEIDA